MDTDYERLVRSFLDCLVNGDIDTAVEHYAEDARYHVSAWREPLVGRAAIRGSSELGLLHGWLTFHV